MPAIAPLEDLKAAQKELLSAKDLDEFEGHLQEMAPHRLEKYL